MAKCHECRRSFRVPEDEADGQHACPHCGYTGEEPEAPADEDEE